MRPWRFTFWFFQALIKFLFSWFGVTANVIFLILFFTGLYLLLSWRVSQSPPYHDVTCLITFDCFRTSKCCIFCYLPSKTGATYDRSSAISGHAYLQRSANQHVEWLNRIEVYLFRLSKFYMKYIRNATSIFSSSTGSVRKRFTEAVPGKRRRAKSPTSASGGLTLWPMNGTRSRQWGRSTWCSSWWPPFSSWRF